jgi:hypothetical protein
VLGVWGGGSHRECDLSLSCLRGVTPQRYRARMYLVWCACYNEWTTPPATPKKRKEQRRFVTSESFPSPLFFTLRSKNNAKQVKDVIAGGRKRKRLGTPRI